MLQFLRSNPERVRLAVLLLLCFFMFFFGAGKRPIWDTDEGLHATSAKQMVVSGDWVVPQFNGEPFYDKPPLFSWLVALSFSLFGFTEFAARLPAALLGLLSVLAVYRFGREMLGPTAAFLGAIVLATTVEFVALSRTIVHDIALELCVAVALFAFFRAHAVERRRTGFLVLAYLATGLAGLAKGPVGILIPGSVFFFYLLARRDLVSIRYMMVLRGALLILLVAAPWYILLALRDPDYLRYFLIEKNFGSFVSKESTHPNPFYFYLPILILGFFPWSCFLPLTLARLLGRLRRLDPARLFLLIWFAFVLLFFSIANSKLPTYILPLFPAVALLIGDLWGDFLEHSEPRLRRGMVVSQLCLIAIMAWAVPVFVLQGTRHPMYDAESHAPHLYALISILVATVLAGSVFLWRRNDRALFAVNASLTGLIIIYGMTMLLPAIDALRTSKRVALELDARLRPGLPLVFFPDLRESALFYTDRRGVELKEAAELEDYLRQPGAICVLDASRLDRVAHLSDHYHVLDQQANKIVVEAVPPSAYMRE